MSETPERKVLKDMLPKLKLKSLSSKERYRRFQINAKNLFEGAVRRAIELVNKRQQVQPQALLGTLEALRLHLENLCSNYETALEDSEIYVETLE